MAASGSIDLCCIVLWTDLGWGAEFLLVVIWLHMRQQKVTFC